MASTACKGCSSVSWRPAVRLFGRRALRLRELRVEAAAAARRELAEDIHPQLLDARAKYTDYVEPVAEEAVATGDDGWD